MNSRLWNLWTNDPTANIRRWQRWDKPAIAPEGDGWKRVATANPDLLQLGDDLLLYYRGTGTAKDDSEPRDQIHVAHASFVGDGIQVFDLPDAPAIPSGGPTAFDADLLDPAAVRYGGEVLLYYSALGVDGDSIGLATSSDGIHFQKRGRVMPGRAPEVALHEGKLYLLSQELGPSGGYELHLFASDNGRDFEKVHSGAVFGAGEGWDSLSVVTCRISSSDGWHWMLYGGSADTVDHPRHFGLARSRDLRTWERHPGNPIFEAGPEGSLDSNAIWFPALHETDDGFAIIYEGSRGSGETDGVICIAFAPMM